ncbi:thiamine pyrophosphate-dependent enzyme [Agrococcus carbonis]|uniref:Acetolactate synthase-1/2/3 large subunit n=1 Tax=Agrococcus carbonis TaxID=684552 RepID=A0A1H1Q927_9MICO|nr:thiamine pyrophosphate-dependent enzyme [Agrococcus carbonis]SDS19409.1 acetolactate synthase-1/2/3 large subunit [Agrococcus carbonis]
MTQLASAPASSPAPAPHPHTDAPTALGAPPVTESAGHAIVRVLEEHGIPRAYVVPGESYLEVLDGLHDSTIETVVCRHEGGAAYMAEAEGKLGHLPGVAMVTRGPGAANALVGVHTAWQDSTAMVLFIGLIPVAHRHKEAFQEFDVNGWFAAGAKQVMVLDVAERAPEVVAEALFTARAGRPGPVVVGLPEDVIRQQIAKRPQPVLPVADGGMTAGDIEALRRALSESRKPLFVTGGNDWDETASWRLTAWLEQHRLPAVAEWRTEGIVPFDSPSYAGPIGYGRPKPTLDVLEECDLLVFIGTLPGDVITDGFLVRQDWSRRNFLVSIDPTLRGRSGAVSHHILARPRAFVRDLEQIDLAPDERRAEWTERLRQQQTAFSALPERTPGDGRASMDTVMAHLVPRLQHDAIVTFGAGEHTNWAHRWFPTRTFPSMLSCGNGSMGYSIPSAVTASLRFPERQVVSIAGDGEFLMNGQELATAKQLGATPLVILVDNQEYGTIRTHQERHHPGRISGTQLENPDFAMLARAYGGHGIRVETDAEVPSAVDAALAAWREREAFVLLHVITEQRSQAY